MFRFLNENFVLKIISLAASIMMWLYVSAERYPNTPVSRTVYAEVVQEGVPPPNVIVHFSANTVQIVITGPKNEVENINDNDVKARFNVSSARLGMTLLRSRPLTFPPNAANVQAAGRPVVSVMVVPKEKKKMAITPELSGVESRFSPPRVTPDMAWVYGTREDLQRVAKLSVFVEATGSGVSEDLSVKAVDKDGIEIPGMEIDPPAAHVELSLAEAPATRTLPVDIAWTGQVAYPYRISDISTVPSQVTVMGKPEQLADMTHVRTKEVELSGLMSDFTRDVPLDLPAGVTLQEGKNAVRVTVKLHDTTRTGTAGP